MANLSGLNALVRAARAYVAAAGSQAVVDSGLKARSFQINQGPGGAQRIVFIMGAFDGNGAPKQMKVGALTKPRHQFTNPRALAWWHKAVTMSVWAVDTTAPNDEAAQIEAVENLFELAVQAVHNAVDPNTDQDVGFADVIWGEVTLTRPPVDMGFGLELLVSFVHNGPLFDAPIPTATPQAAVSRNPTE